MITGTQGNALSVSGLTKHYGQFQVLNDLNLGVATGSIHGLVGLNGSGKTTTLECILGLQAFNAGSISVLGRQPDALNRAQGQIVGIFDTPSLNPNLTVRQCMRLAKMLCPEPRRTPADVEALLGIERFRDFRIKQLSLGNKRRAAIAHALLANPALIILDEPFNGLDAGGVDDVLALITRLNQEQGTSFLLSSHQLPYLEQVCSHLAILHKGRIVSNGEVQNLLAGTDTVALIRTTASEQAENLLAEHNDFQLLEPTNADYLQIALGDSDPAALNQLLVSHDIPVQELILERASLDKLFRDLTREPAT